MDGDEERNDGGVRYLEFTDDLGCAWVDDAGSNGTDYMISLASVNGLSNGDSLVEDSKRHHAQNSSLFRSRP